MARRAPWSLALAPALMLACGGDDNATTPIVDASVDASVPDTSDATPAVDVADVYVDAGFDASLPPLKPYERFVPVDYLGGALLTSMKVITVTFQQDDANLVARLQKFGDTITSTQWWTDSTAEYCVMPKGAPCIGPGTGGGHVVITTPAPANLVDTDDGKGSSVVQFIQDHIDNGDLPTPDDQTIYQIYYPPGTTIKFDGLTSCSGFGAYHYSAPFTPKGGGKPVEAAYAIEPRCSGETYTTFAASHELIEAATDAHPGKDRGYVMQDYGWEYFGDLCDYPWEFTQMTESTFNVQRGWSNKSGRAGHDPCVTQPKSEVYFNVAPEAGKQEVYLAVGESITFDLEGYSDAMTGDWNLSAQDISGRIGENGTLSFAFDKTTINANQTVKLTIKLNGKPTQAVAPYVIHSTSGAGHHWWGATVRLR
jgi:hypothetical protein